MPACLRMVLAAKGVAVSEKRLRDLCEWKANAGCLSANVVAAARALGFVHSQEDYGLRLYDLRDALRVGIFPIVGIDLLAYGRMGQHAQVVASVTTRGVSVQDPLLGQFVSRLMVFEEAWRYSDFLTILIG
ncbi:MAG: hypothetical protein HY231_11035 [Acidobacteria bacterium]|nr:hypothetical protein [Acidobacteriota bacterium]